jgi:hypothetical protein
MLELSFAAVQARPATRATVPRIDNYNAPTLLTYRSSPLPFQTLISSWFQLRSRAKVSEAITLFCGPYYAPFIYSQHRYASTFQSAEALAKMSSAKEKSTAQHKERVRAVRLTLLMAQFKGYVDSDVAGWATRVIQGRNDKSLGQLMKELISSTEEMGRQLIESTPNIADLIAATRTSVSHPGVRSTERLQRYLLGEALTWIVRVRILAELGVSVNELSSMVVQKPSFQQLLLELPTVTTSGSER